MNLPPTLILCLVVFVRVARSAIHAGLGSYNYGFDVQPLVRRQTGERVVVTRLHSHNGTIPVRPEIRELKRDPFKWNLYLLALSMMQYTDQDQELSWYQITGIHGVPFVPWNDVQRVPGGRGGYCTHMSILFPTWHRPYLALYEQSLFQLAQLIASWFPDPAEKARYEAAAADFRIPYWDWALTPVEGESVFLSDFQQPAITVYGPNGQQFISNPLFSYRFRPLDPGVFEWGQFPHWTETKRAPFGNDSDNTRVARAMDRIQPNLQERLYNLLVNSQEYGPFSNKHWTQNTEIAGYDSLESLHDEVHIEVGNRGHLYFIQYSAFDPIFFLHHAMADRIFSIWQALYPDSWVTDQLSTTPTFTIANGTILNGSTPLTPFLADSLGNFWTSDAARYTPAFGYSYAETSSLDSPSESTWRRRQDRAQLRTTIHQLYGPVSMLTNPTQEPELVSRQSRHWFTPSRQGTKSPFPDVPDLSQRHRAGDNTAPSILVQGHYHEWIANVRVMNGALNGSFSVHFFLGPPPIDTSTWQTALNLVGTMGIFAMSHKTSHGRVSGTVPLTRSLAHLVGQEHLQDLGPVSIEQYLQDSLQFRIQGPNGEVDARRVPGLCISIASSRVRATQNDGEFPVWGPLEEKMILLC